MIHIDTTVANLILGTIIPIITALVVKDVASPGIKAIVNAFLAALAGGITVALQAGGILNWQSLLISMASTVGVAVVAYFGLLKPTGVTGLISTSTANFGVGTPQVPAQPHSAVAPKLYDQDAQEQAPPGYSKFSSIKDKRVARPVPRREDITPA